MIDLACTDHLCSTAALIITHWLSRFHLTVAHLLGWIGSQKIGHPPGHMQDTKHFLFLLKTKGTKLLRQFSLVHPSQSCLTSSGT